MTDNTIARNAYATRYNRRPKRFVAISRDGKRHECNTLITAVQWLRDADNHPIGWMGWSMAFAEVGGQSVVRSRS